VCPLVIPTLPYVPFHSVWTLWLAVCTALVIAFVVLCSVVSSSLYPKLRTAAILVSFAILLSYALMNSGGLFALGSNASLLEMLLLITPAGSKASRPAFNMITSIMLYLCAQGITGETRGLRPLNSGECR
jgi:hypothetical protein